MGSLSLSVAQLEALDFPSSGLGQLGDELDDGGALVARETGPAVRDDVIGGRRVAVRAVGESTGDRQHRQEEEERRDGRPCEEAPLQLQPLPEDRRRAADRDDPQGLERLVVDFAVEDLVERPLIRSDEPWTIQKDTNIVVHPTYPYGGYLNWLCDNYIIGGNGPGDRIHQFPEEIIEIDV